MICKSLHPVCIYVEKNSFSSFRLTYHPVWAGNLLFRLFVYDILCSTIFAVHQSIVLPLIRASFDCELRFRCWTPMWLLWGCTHARQSVLCPITLDPKSPVCLTSVSAPYHATSSVSAGQRGTGKEGQSGLGTVRSNWAKCECALSLISNVTYFLAGWKL